MITFILTQRLIYSFVVRLFVCLFLCLTPLSYAGPGAHGPNGEHLDTPDSAHAHSHGQSDKPRMETFSEIFELVATLEHDELSILIDRYETNEPVLHGRLEVEVAGIKAIGQFHVDHGDYSVTDPRLLKALSQPGKHALVFTIFSNNDSDLLEGLLSIPAPHIDHSVTTIVASCWKMALGLAVGGLIVIGLFLKYRRSRVLQSRLNDQTRNSL